jgi:O-antigen/teichoic acid export membrane protein
VASYGVREVAKEKNDAIRLSNLVSELIILHIISSLCRLILYAAGIYRIWGKIEDIRLLLFSVFFSSLIFFMRMVFFGMEKFGYITIRSISVRLLGLASIFILVNNTKDYYLYYGIVVASAIITNVWNIITLFREIKFSFRTVDWKRPFRHVWTTYFISLLYSIFLMPDNVILRLINNASAVGSYTFSIKIIRTPASLLTDSFLAFFSELFGYPGTRTIPSCAKSYY